LQIIANETITRISVSNIIGQEVKNNHPKILNPIIDMSDLSSGTYFVKVIIGNLTSTFKVLK